MTALRTLTNSTTTFTRMRNNLIIYNTPDWLKAFTTGKGVEPEQLGIGQDALVLPRQTHSDHVLWSQEAGRPEDTDAVITDSPGLCVCVKTADCIPILLYDARQRIVAAVHAGWRGTVAGIVRKTIKEMMPLSPADIHAIIGPGISLECFEVGDEVYDVFQREQFPMQRIAKRFPADGGESWHIDLWEANRWLMEQEGVTDIFVQGICTRNSMDFYSARRETINTGRNYNGIMILQ